MRIDAHHHLWDLSRRPQEWLAELPLINRSFGLDDLPEGFDRTVLVQVLADLDETREFLALAADNPRIAGVVGWVDLTAPDVGDVLDALPAGLVGIRHLVQAEPDPRWLLRSDVQRGIRAVGDRGLVYDLLTLPPQLPAAIELVNAQPNTRFVLDHLSKPPLATGDLADWAADLRELAKAPNVVAKLSGLVTEANWDSWSLADLRPAVEVALEAFGPSRLMFGSDWPVCLLAAPYADVTQAAETLTSDLSSTERAQIFGTTAASVYRLTV
ncbi:amidohydrolase family protein [Cryptosporangium sp. NPDC048952]|uniref:amidohydrolase family protein n=1 Tax=Cryptosporangium sp. NPDC048952 TaxID=3363961 RepID=UPI003714C2F4